MKFVFLGLSRKTKRKLKILLLIFTFFAGVFTAAETRFAIMRVAHIAVVPRSDILSSESVWGTIEPRYAKCWPLLLLHKVEYEAAVEKLHPVDVTLKLAGWGKFKLTAESLEPAFKLYWKEKFWYVSSDGRVWLATLKDNKTEAVSKVDGMAILTWGDIRTTPIDFANARGSVHRSSLPVDRIKQWYDNIAFLGWSDKIKFIQAGKREGDAVVRLIFKGGVSILFPDDPKLWREPGVAIKKIYPNISSMTSEIFIDTTYKDKILVRNKVQ